MTIKATFRQPVIATELRFGKSSERAVGANGEVNANSKRDLAVQIAKLLEVAGTQEVITASEAEQRATVAAGHAKLVEAAFASADAHKEVGANLADDLYIAANREGFMRRLLAQQTLSQGQIPRVKLRRKNSVAVVAGSPTQVRAQLARDNTLYPSEFYINSRIFVEEREIAQSVSDVLSEKLVEAQEGIMVAEDRTFIRLANATVNLENEFTNISGSLTPTALAALRNNVTRWNIPAATFLIATDIWNDIIGNAQFSDLIDPVSKHELLLTGQIGQILGMDIITDGFRHPEHKVFSQGQMFVVGDSVNLGTYTDRGGITSAPIDITTEMVPGRGWVLSELISAVIANARAVSAARRT